MPLLRLSPLIRRVRRTAGFATVLMLGLTSSLGAQGGSGAEGWLVVPFEVAAPSTRTFWLGEGVAVLVNDELERLGRQAIPREARVGALDDLRLPAGVTLSKATHIRIGELLGAAVVVFGEISADEAGLTVRARALRLETGQPGPELLEQGQPADLFALCQRMARRLAGGEPTSPSAPPQAGPHVEAYEAYVKALLTDRPETRVRLLQAALEKAPEHDRTRLALWEAYTDLGEHRSALESLQGVSETSSLSPAARFKGALSLIELGRHDEAFERLKALAESHPSAAVFNNLGVLQLRRGWTPQTGLPTYYFNRAAELEHDDADLCFNLGYAYWEQRDTRGAVYWLRETLRRRPTDAEAHLVLAAALEREGATLEAARERALASQLSSRYAEAARRPAADGLPRRLERLKDALVPMRPLRFDRSLTTAARDDQQELVTFHLARARRLFDDHQDGDAEAELRRVLFLSPYHSEAHQLVGRIYLRSGRPHEALAAFRIAVWAEDSVQARVSLAEALFETRDLAAARAELERALALDPESPDVRALLARVDAASPR